MTVRDWDEQRLGMNFENICVLCSDIDMIHVTSGGKLVIGEIKNEQGVAGWYKGGQRNMLTQIVDQHKLGGAVLFIVHDTDIHEVPENEREKLVVNVANCEVKEYYLNGKWFTPRRKTTVNEIMDLIEAKEVKSMGATIEGKAKVWSKEHDGWTSYTVSVSSKDQNGNWVNAYQPVRFKKGTPKIENGTEINYKGFATVMKGKEHNYVMWQITEFTFAGNETSFVPEPSFGQLTENDIPF